MFWVYDGTFEGFLSCVAESYERRILPERIERSRTAAGLFEQLESIETDTEKSGRLFDAMKEQFGKKICERIYHAYLCDSLSPEAELLHYIRLGFKSPTLLESLSHPVVYAVEQYEHRLLRALHQMVGFARFESVETGVLYARIEPPQNVLPLMGHHFKKRFGSESFIIHDLKRATALVHTHGTLELHDVHNYDLPRTDSDEKRFAELWRLFFENVCIESRRNEKLQRQHVPLLYRRWMTEFDGVDRMTSGNSKREPFVALS